MSLCICLIELQPFCDDIMTDWIVYKENKYLVEQTEDKGEF